MNSKNLIFTFVVAMCLLISVVHSQQECRRLTNPCTEGCCVLPTLLSIRGECSSGLEGQKCDGIRRCPCGEGLKCENGMCAAKTDSSSTTTTTTMQPTSVTAETTTPSTNAPAEATTPEVTTPSTAAPETST